MKKKTNLLIGKLVDNLEGFCNVWKINLLFRRIEYKLSFWTVENSHCYWFAGQLKTIGCILCNVRYIVHSWYTNIQSNIIYRFFTLKELGYMRRCLHHKRRPFVVHPYQRSFLHCREPACIQPLPPLQLQNWLICSESEN